MKKVIIGLDLMGNLMLKFGNLIFWKSWFYKWYILCLYFLMYEYEKKCNVKEFKF